MQKILHYCPRLRAGSPMALAVDLACGLQDSECANIIISPPCELNNRLNSAGVKHITCRHPGLFSAWQEIRRLRNIICKHKPQVLPVYSADAAWIAGMACRHLKAAACPKIIGVLTGYPRKGIPSVGWRYCRAFTSISKHLRGVLESPGSALVCKPWVIPYGVNEALCNPNYTPSTAWLEQWNRTLPPTAVNKLKLCIPGAISPMHALEDIIPILTGLLRSGVAAHVFIAGDTRRANKEHLAALRQKYEDARLAEHITWLGARPDLRDVLCACDVTLTLSREPKTWDRAVLEALALGRPVVGYDHGVIGEYMEAFLPEGRVAPGDTAGIIDTLSQWHTYSPEPVSEVPFPYRLSDTIQTYRTLFLDIQK